MKTILRILVIVLGRSIYRLFINGRQHVPKSTGALLVANHASYMDFVLIVCAVPRKVRFVMNADVFRKPGLSWLLKSLNCVPVDTAMGKEGLQAFNSIVVEQIAAGHVVAIFAEGTVTRTGQVLTFKRGVEHLSGMIDGPIIPIHFDNVIGTPFTFRAGKRKMIIPGFSSLRRRVNINIGRPINGNVSAFQIRQRIKLLEAESFALRFSPNDSIFKRLVKVLSQNPTGSWTIDDKKIYFREIPKRIASMSSSMGQPFHNAQKVALLVPKSLECFLLNVLCIVHQKCVLNLDSGMDQFELNELLETAEYDLLITSKQYQVELKKDLVKSVFFLEDTIMTEEKIGQSKDYRTRVKKAISDFRNFFNSRSSLYDTVVQIAEKNQSGNYDLIALHNLNLLAVTSALRQVYYFEKNSILLANLELYHSYGFVLELLLPIISDLRVESFNQAATIEDFSNRLLATKSSLVLTTPSQLKAVDELAQKKNLSFITNIFTADIDPSHKSIQALTARGLPVMTCAGLHRTTSVFSVNIENYKGLDIVGKPMEQEASEHGSIGKPLPGVVVKIMDLKDQNRELEEGQEGRMYVRGACVAHGRSEGKSTSKMRLENDQWLNTGWIASMSKGGFIYLSKSQTFETRNGSYSTALFSQPN